MEDARAAQAGRGRVLPQFEIKALPSEIAAPRAMPRAVGAPGLVLALRSYDKRRAGQGHADQIALPVKPGLFKEAAHLRPDR